MLPFLSSLHHLACGTDTYSTAITDSFNAKKKKTDLNHYERDHSARRKSLTERSERIDEEAEENR